MKVRRDGLNPRLFNSDGDMREEVKEKLLEIANNFISSIVDDEVDIDVVDIQVVGSNASYNYTSSSDIDLHIIVNLQDNPNADILEKLYGMYAANWNNTYSPTIYDHEVEIYVELKEEEEVEDETGEN